jgi:hypothetical protein
MIFYRAKQELKAEGGKVDAAITKIAGKDRAKQMSDCHSSRCKQPRIIINESSRTQDT